MNEESTSFSLTVNDGYMTKLPLALVTTGDGLDGCIDGSGYSEGGGNLDYYYGYFCE